MIWGTTFGIKDNLPLESMARKVSFEDAKLIVPGIIQCAANVMNAVNGPLQGRADVLNLDLNRVNEKTIDACESIDRYENDYLLKKKNLCYQKQTANIIINQTSEMISSITRALNIHLNINQSIITDTNSVYFLLEKTRTEFLLNRTIHQIHLPSNFNLSVEPDAVVLLRLMIEPLSLNDNYQIPSITNLSRSISFSILDEKCKNIAIEADISNPIELFILRDPNLIIPKLFLQDVIIKSVLFNFHSINLSEVRELNSNLTYSIHFEMHPLDKNLSYLLIHKFNSTPQLTSSINDIDGWSLFCSSNSEIFNEEDGIYTYFIDNQQTINQHSVTFGIRQLTLIEIEDFCWNKTLNLPITDEPVNFSSNYEIRSYFSGCYYLDSNNKWQSDELLVGPLTNHSQTQCFSTHLTTFASPFFFSSSPIEYNSRNNNLFLGTICMEIIYPGFISLMIFRKMDFTNKAEMKDKIDRVIKYLKALQHQRLVVALLRMRSLNQ